MLCGPLRGLSSLFLALLCFITPASRPMMSLLDPQLHVQPVGEGREGSEHAEPPLADQANDAWPALHHVTVISLDVACVNRCVTVALRAAV